MNCEKKPFMHWNDAWTLTHGDVEIIVVTEIGPRILSIKIAGGDNILFVDTKGIARDDWRIYGGHRIWFGPETEQCYAPDNSPCKVECTDDALIIEAPVDPATNLRKIMRVRDAENGFSIENAVKNDGDMLAFGTIWALTCVRPDAQVFFPWGTPKKWDVKKICYWREWGGTHGSTIRSEQWEQGDDLFVVRPTGEEGKVGTAGYEGWIAATFPACKTTLCKSFDYIRGGKYSDQGCAVECYTCPDFIELETLSPEYVVHPGEEVSHVEKWCVKNEIADVNSAELARKVVRK